MIRQTTNGHRMKPSRGISLVELIIAMVIFTVGATLTLQGFIQPARSIAYDAAVQTATNIAQECAEHLLNLRGIQTNGWLTIPVDANTLCDGIPYSPSFNRLVTIALMNDDVSPPCLVAFTPDNKSCRKITITVSKNDGLIPTAVYEFTIVNY